MSEFYTNCQTIRNEILYRGVSSTGKRVRKRIQYKPSLFIPNTSNGPSKYKTIFGKPVEKITFDGIYETRDFLKQYRDVSNFEISGNTNFQYCYLSDTFPGEVEYDADRINIGVLDIEVSCTEGFPSVDEATEPVLAISLKVGDIVYVLGTKDFNDSRATAEFGVKVSYEKCEDEWHLLTRFIEIWRSAELDIVTGWNVNLFDIPYLVNRCARVLGDKAAKKLSPWESFSERTITIMGRVHKLFTLRGVCILDYLDLYKKYSPKANQESYKLDYIANVELGVGKLAHGNLNEMYENEFQKFIEYNIQDVLLVSGLEDKMKIIDLIIVLAYDAKVNFDDVLSQVRVWDNLIFNELRKNNIVIPFKHVSDKESSYAGAYVKEPLLGLHHWVGCVDVASLYPNLIRMFNISPETLVDRKSDISIDSLLAKKVDLDSLKTDNLTMAANGHFFRKDIEGFLPSLMTRLYNERVIYKKKMLEAKKQLELVKKEIKRRHAHVQ